SSARTRATTGTGWRRSSRRRARAEGSAVAPLEAEGVAVGVADPGLGGDGEAQDVPVERDRGGHVVDLDQRRATLYLHAATLPRRAGRGQMRSEERRVGKECRSGGGPES